MKRMLLTMVLALAVWSTKAQSDTQSAPLLEKEQASSAKVKVFPNPATHVVNVLGLLNTNDAQITISNMYGKTVLYHEWEIRNNALNIPISNLETGIYVIVIRSEEEQVKTKFYKQ